MLDGTCAPCARGFYCGKGDVPMIQCPNGQTTVTGVAAQSANECTVTCPTGYGMNVADGSCQPCALGKYSPDAQTDCTACPDGLTTSITGATAVAACVNCPAGKAVSSKVPGIAGCVACRAGRYSAADMADVDICDGICPVGQTTVGTGADSSAKCTIACDLGMAVRDDTGKCDNCAIGKYEVNNICKTCQRCKGTLAAGTLDSSECDLDAPMCTAGEGPDAVTLKCVTCPVGKYSMGGTGSLICGGGPTVAPTTETVTKISVKHTYSLQVGATKFNSASFIPSFSKAVTTVLKVPDDAVIRFTKTPLLQTGRRYLLAIYTSQISYDVVAYNVNPKTLTDTLGNPATSGLIGSIATQLTGIAGTVGTITFVDASPSSGPSRLPTPFSFFAQTGTVSGGIDTMLLIGIVIGFGVGCPVLACIYYQSTLLARLCRRGKPYEQKPDAFDSDGDLDSIGGTGVDEYGSYYNHTGGGNVARAVALDPAPAYAHQAAAVGAGADSSAGWAAGLPQVPFFSFWPAASNVQPSTQPARYDSRLDAEDAEDEFVNDIGGRSPGHDAWASDSRAIEPRPSTPTLPPEATYAPSPAPSLAMRFNPFASPSAAAAPHPSPSPAREHAPSYSATPSAPLGDNDGIGSTYGSENVSVDGWDAASAASSDSASVSMFNPTQWFGSASKNKSIHATETHNM